MTTSRTSSFSEKQTLHAYPKGVDAHFWLRARNRIIYEKIRDIAGAAPVLDLGCGPGITVHYLRRHGLHCYGCDLAQYTPIDPVLHDLIWYRKDAFTLPTEQRERIQTLLLLDVLEHIDRSQEFLGQCVSAFPELRTILITLPARQELWSNYDEYYDHVRRYDRQSAVQLCTMPGLEVEEAGYFFHCLYPPLAMQAFLNLDRSVEWQPVRWRTLHDLATWILYLDLKLLPKGLPGTSVFVQARVNR